MVFDWFRRQFKREEDAPPSAEPTPTPTPDQPTAEASTPATPTATPATPDDYLAWAKAAYQNIQRQQAERTPPPAAEAAIPTPEPTAEPTPEPTAAPTPASLAPEAAAPIPEAIAPVLTPEAEPGEPAPIAVSAAAGVPEPEPEAEPEAIPVAPPPEVVPLSERVPSTIAPEPALTAELAEAVATEKTIATLETTPAASPEATSEIAPDVVPDVVPGVVPEVPVSAPVEVGVEAAPLPFWVKAEAERQARLERLKAGAIEEPEPEPITPTPEPEATLPGLAFDENFIWSAEVLAAQGRRPEEISVEEITWLKRLRQGLDKTRRGLVNQLKAIVGQGPLNQAAVMEIEALLLQADVGIDATDYIIEALQAKLREEALPPEQAIAYLKSILREMLDRPLQKTGKPILIPDKDRLNIWLITGVNGAGKTTTIGKLAHLARKSDYSCLIAAADTFRAAAVEQVKVWGQRSGVEVIANPGKNTDPAAVVYDAITAAQSRGTELLLVDTAGRLQNKKNLMDELNKIRRVIDKQARQATIESLLVLDATLGQNGLRQAEVFSEAANLSGVILTKLDSTAKGGIALAIVQQLGLPIYFIGAGEGITDLRPFSSYEFVEALISG
ncbi:signal recognition particle-docking protein FtsY [Trichothermofontia sichuanensis B231]|uniref:signal recognition particle-docking protein FtsY n=1 Tax=Trichothermofontia sichuanensis TaxID=3045816 RepID=UPI0022477699|nr:signal recognition particle-docking protein FtsY [Trichothermofontia sichuanensis]UZQ56239.1 signal recognition particle-docking protein FtsY [Trichothermofontia sichuanensis B231]